MAVRVVGEQVVATWGRERLVVDVSRPDHVRVEVSRLALGPGTPVQDDLARLLRVATRFVVADPRGARRLVGEVARRTGQRVPDGPTNHALVRLTWPLLIGEPHLSQPHLPTAVPGWLRPAFRARAPRDAAGILFACRPTRPVVRGLCDLLAAQDPADLLVLSVAVAASSHEQPDQLARTLALRGTGPTEALDEPQVEALRHLLDGLSPVRRRRRLEEAVADPTGRARLVAVTRRWEPGRPTLADTDDWQRLGIALATSHRRAG